MEKNYIVKDSLSDFINSLTESVIEESDKIYVEFTLIKMTSDLELNVDIHDAKTYRRITGKRYTIIDRVCDGLDAEDDLIDPALERIKTIEEEVEVNEIEAV